MTRAPSPEVAKTTDLECLRCGVKNVPENRVCGRCGASLPTVYDREGRPRRPLEDRRRREVRALARLRRRVGPWGGKAALRAVVVLAALLAAAWILKG